MVEALDALSRRARWSSWRCGCRCRPSTSSTTAASSPAASNRAAWRSAMRSSSCPRARSPRSARVESWPVTPVKGAQTAGRSVGITLDRELFIERGDVISHVGTSPRDTRRLHARMFWLHDKPLPRASRSWCGSARGKPAPRWSRSTRRSIPVNCRASRPSRSPRTMSARSRSRWPSRSPPIPTPTIRAPAGW